MKRVKNLFPKLISDENIKQAIIDVNKSHKRTRRGLNRTVRELKNRYANPKTISIFHNLQKEVYGQ